MADAYLDDLIDLDPTLGTYLGVRASARLLPDYSPTGAQAQADLARVTLDRLAEAEPQTGAGSAAERRCARLLRERLTAHLAVYEADEHLRAVGNTTSPAHSIREAFTLMPTDTAADYADLAARMRAVPAALDGYRACLLEGMARDLLAGPRQVDAVIRQVSAWVGDDAATSWFTQLAAAGPPQIQAELASAAADATAAYAGLRDWLRDIYTPAVEGSPDTVGRNRYARWARFWNGSDTDLDEAYASWAEYLWGATSELYPWPVET